MIPGKENLEIYAGATYKKTFQWTIVNGTTSVPVDITGSTIRMQIREKINSPAILIELTTANNRIRLTDATNGVFQLYLTDAETSALGFKTGVYDIEIKLFNNEVERFVEGVVIVHPEVTR